MTLLQTVAVATADTVTPTSIAVAFAGFVLAGFWREIHTFKRHINQWQAKIDVVLFGAQGDNGLNGGHKDHEQRLRSLERHHSSAEERTHDRG